MVGGERAASENAESCYTVGSIESPRKGSLPSFDLPRVTRLFMPSTLLEKPSGGFGIFHGRQHLKRTKGNCRFGSDRPVEGEGRDSLVNERFDLGNCSFKTIQSNLNVPHGPQEPR